MKLSELIAFWSGSIASIPAGWALCDGTQGTPDLRDSFVIPAGYSFSPDDSGGSPVHTHAFTGHGHFHTRGGPEPAGMLIGTDYDRVTSTNSVTGTTDEATLLPPYHALLPIMIL